MANEETKAQELEVQKTDREELTEVLSELDTESLEALREEGIINVYKC